MNRIFQILVFIICSKICFGQTALKTDTGQVIGAQPEIAASYPGGMNGLMHYINETITKNLALSESEVSTLRKVYVKFIIDPKGKVDSVSILRSSKVAKVDSIVTQAVKAMPLWKAATMNGKSVKQEYILPLTICFK